MKARTVSVLALAAVCACSANLRELDNDYWLARQICAQHTRCGLLDESDEDDCAGQVLDHARDSEDERDGFTFDATGDDKDACEAALQAIPCSGLSACCLQILRGESPEGLCDCSFAIPTTCLEEDSGNAVLSVDGSGCSDTCHYSNDGTCDDGGPGSKYSMCALGTDCSDCGPRDSGGSAGSGGWGGSGGNTLCSDSCSYYAGDGYCSDGGPGSTSSLCELGTDCSDCGPRESTSECRIELLDTTCTSCMQAYCSTECAGCTGSCQTLAQCWEECGPDQSCRQQCAQAYSEGYNTLQKLLGPCLTNYCSAYCGSGSSDWNRQDAMEPRQ